MASDDESEPQIYYPRCHFYLEETLCEAAQNNDLSKTRRILLERVDPNWLNGFGLSPLHIACRFGNFEVAKILICNRAVVDVQNAIGITPLHLAAKYNQLKCVQLLLLSGAVAFKACWSLCTPREFAPNGSKVQKVLELAEQGIIPDPARVFEMAMDPLVPKFAIPQPPDQKELKKKQEGKLGRKKK